MWLLVTTGTGSDTFMKLHFFPDCLPLLCYVAWKPEIVRAYLQLQKESARLFVLPWVNWTLVLRQDITLFQLGIYKPPFILSYDSIEDAVFSAGLFLLGKAIFFFFFNAGLHFLCFYCIFILHFSVFSTKCKAWLNDTTQFLYRNWATLVNGSSLQI